MGITNLQGEQGRQATFHGSAGTLFGIIVTNWFITILTLGIYYFWAKTRVRQFLFSHIEFDGDRFDYHGTGWELCLGALKSLVVIIPMAIIAYLLPPGIDALFVYLTIMLLVPFAWWGARRYQLSRVSWRGVRFSFRGSVKACYAIMVPGVLFTGLSLGLFYPYFRARLTAYWMNHTYFGNTPFRYVGHEKDLFAIYMNYWVRNLLFIFCAIALVVAAALWTSNGLGGLRELLHSGSTTVQGMHIGIMVAMQVVVLVLYAAIGLNWVWWKAAEQRFHWGHTGFMKAHCYSNISGGAIVVLHLVHALVAIFTLGLGFAWIKADRLRFRLSRVTVAGFIDFEEIMQELHAAQGSASAEGLADALDIGSGVGLEIG